MRPSQVIRSRRWLITAISLSLFGAGLLAFPSGAATTTTTVMSSGDAYVASRFQNRNFGSANFLRASSGDNIRKSYIKFNVPATSGTVTKAVLSMKAKTINASYNIAKTGDFEESTITYKNAPEVGAVIATSRTTAESSIDITSAITAGSARTVTFAITSPYGLALDFGSRESKNPPKLVITTETAAATTTTNAPTTTSTTKPATPVTTTTQPTTTTTSGGSTPRQMSFTKYMIDQVPPGSVVEKTMADVTGDGRLDAVIGTQTTPNVAGSVGGLYYYAFPSSGNAADPWKRVTIASGFNAYEDINQADIDKDGRIDIVAAIGTTETSAAWFRNPGDGSSNWQRFTIGTGHGENTMSLTDLDGDGKLDIATNTTIFFQNSPTSWTPFTYNPGVHLGMDLLDVGSGKGRINLVSNSITNKEMAFWYENPREHGGNARTDTWNRYPLGPTYKCDSSSGTFCPDGGVATLSTGDFNGDGRMDVVAGQSEGGDPGFAPPPGGVRWFEAPADRKSTWTTHAIDPTFQDTHRLRVVDVNRDGKLDLVAGEQEQSVQDRISVFYNDGRGNFTQQVLSHDGGHNTYAADANGDGWIDILNSPHGYFGDAHPLTIYINKG